MSETLTDKITRLVTNHYTAIGAGIFGSLLTITIGFWMSLNSDITVPTYFDLLPGFSYLLIGANAGFNFGRALKTTEKDSHIFWFIYFGSLFSFSGYQYLINNPASVEFQMSLFAMLTFTFLVSSNIYEKNSIPYLTKLIDFTSDYISYFTFFVYITVRYIFIPGLLNGINAFLLYIIVAILFWTIGILTFKKSHLKESYDYVPMILFAIAIIFLIIGYNLYPFMASIQIEIPQ